MAKRQQGKSVDLWLVGGFFAASVVSVVSFVSLLLAGTEQAGAYWGLVFGLPIFVVALSLGWAVVSTPRTSVTEGLPPLWFEASSEPGAAQEWTGSRRDATPARGHAATAPR